MQKRFQGGLVLWFELVKSKEIGSESESRLEAEHYKYDLGRVIEDL